jgi:hypothetical protein
MRDGQAGSNRSARLLFQEKTFDCRSIPISLYPVMSVALTGLLLVYIMKVLGLWGSPIKAGSTGVDCSERYSLPRFANNGQ